MPEGYGASGALDGMPDEMQLAVLRGFQVHDILHVLTGYDSSGQGEIALQAFSLVQLQCANASASHRARSPRSNLQQWRLQCPPATEITIWWRRPDRLIGCPTSTPSISLC